jgi:hypothetical protein
MHTAWPSDVSNLIEQHLDRVDDMLRAAGRPRPYRRDVTDNLEAQFRDTLHDRCPACEPTIDDARALLAGMDPPEAFKVDAAAAPLVKPAKPPCPSVKVGVPPRLSFLAVVALLFALSGFALFVPVAYIAGGNLHHLAITQQAKSFEAAPLFLPPVAVAQATTAPFVRAAASPYTAPWIIYFIAHQFVIAVALTALVLPLSFLGTLLGWIAWRRIVRRPAELYGRLLALLAGLWWPLTLLTYGGLILCFAL